MSIFVIIVGLNDMMSDVQDIFCKNNIYYIFVVDDGKVVGIISKFDYYCLLYGFILFKIQKSEQYNDVIMCFFLAGEVMIWQVVIFVFGDLLEMAVGFFWENFFYVLFSKNL